MKIVKILETGEGLSENNLLVPFVLEGEEVEVLKKGKQGILKKIVKPSLARRNSKCSHFQTCGGCQWQHIHYEEQLRIKKRNLEEKFQHILKWNQDIPIHSQEEWFYRNKLDLSFGVGFNTGEKAIGLHPRGVYSKILDLKECFIFDPKLGELLTFVKELTQDQSYYEVKKEEGFLRNLILRKEQDQWMILLVTNEKKETWILNFFQQLQKKISYVVSCYWALNQKKNDALWDLEFKKILGQDYLEVKGFFLGPKSFFQPNEKTHELFFQLVKDFVQAEEKDVLLDLYCGVGTLGLVAGVNQIIGIENNYEAIEIAKINSKGKNALYFCQSAEQSLNEIIQQYKINKIILDPPRAGLEDQVIKILNHCSVKDLIYISCHPATLLRDLTKLNYELVRVEALDQFPQTRHVEVFTHLKKKEK